MIFSYFDKANIYFEDYRTLRNKNAASSNKVFSGIQIFSHLKLSLNFQFSMKTENFHLVHIPSTCYRFDYHDKVVK